MNRLFTLVGKNLKLLLRTKSSAVVVILGPLLLVLLTSIAFNTAQIHGISVGSFSESYSSLSESILKDLEKEQLTVVKMDSEDACINGVKQSAMHVCAIFPPNMEVSSESEVIFYVDNSRLNVAYMVVDKISSQITTKSKQVSEQLTKGIIDTLSETASEITDKETLVRELSNSNRNANERLTTVSQLLTEMDLELDLRSKIDQIQEDLALINNSGAVLVDINNLQKELNVLADNLEIAVSNRRKSLDNINVVKQLLKDNIGYVQTVLNSFENIHEGVESIRTTSVGNIVSPIKVKIEPIVPKEKNVNFLFPTLIAMIIMFVALFLSSTLEVKEKSSQAYFKNFITPTSDLMFMFGNFITNLLITTVQLLLLFTLAFFFFREQISPIIGPLALFLFVTTSAFIFLGMILGNIFKSEQTTNLAAILIGFILLFFSSTVIPIEALPGMLAQISSYNPFYLIVSVLSKLLLFQVSLFELLIPLYFLLGYLVVFFALALITKKIFGRRV